jgi:hypothetical protein
MSTNPPPNPPPYNTPPFDGPPFNRAPFNGPPFSGAWWENIRRTAVHPSDMRVSDAERQSMSELLSRHYADGRLDDGEFQERLEKAMSAKTRADLGGLTYDLPRLDVQGPVAPQGLHRHRPWIFYALIWLAVWCAVATAASLAGSFWMPHFGFLLFLGVLALFIIRRGRHHHHHHRGFGQMGGWQGGPPADQWAGQPRTW